MRIFRKPSTFWYAVALFVASTVGIGFFGIPYTFAKAGTGIGLIFLLLLGGLMLVSNLMYGEIILRTHNRHQFVGYVRTYLGPGARIVNLFNFWVAVFGAVMGIIVINGQFLSKILELFSIHIGSAILSVVFALVACILVYLGLKTVSHVDFFVMLIVVLMMILIVAFGAHHIEFENFSFSTGSAWFLPFGVILFSLNGMQGLPLLREILVGRERKLKTAILIGTIIPVVLYLIFSLTVVGISGGKTTMEALPGLAPYVGKYIVSFGALFGFITSSSIFISILTAFRTSLKEDFNLTGKFNFLLILLPPLLLFLLGVRNFIGIIGFVGGVAVSIDMILLLLIYAKTKTNGNRIPEYSLRLPHTILYAAMILFALGAIYTLLV